MFIQIVATKSESRIYNVILSVCRMSVVKSEILVHNMTGMSWWLGGFEPASHA